MELGKEEDPRYNIPIVKYRRENSTYLDWETKTHVKSPDRIGKGKTILLFGAQFFGGEPFHSRFTRDDWEKDRQRGHAEACSASGVYFGKS